MTHHDQILKEAIISISKYIINMDVHQEKIIKLILENLMFSAKIELLREINEERR